MTIRFRRPASSYWAEYLILGISTVGSVFPWARPSKNGVAIKKNVPYKDTADKAHTMDILYPSAPSNGPRPMVLFVHGGSFMMLSKNTHNALAMQFAMAGCVVFNINYRLAPKHAFPHGLEDVCDAWMYMLDHAAEYGGDPQRAIITGESAGGNLITALGIATVWKRPEAFAAKVFDRGVVPVAVMPFCPMLSVSRPRRFIERKPHLPKSLSRKIEVAGRIYLQDRDHGESTMLADPLIALQSEHAFDRPLPAFFVAVGTKDPLLDDARQMAAALAARQTACEVRYYPGGIHAFHGFLWQPLAKECWKDAIAFVTSNLTAKDAKAGGDAAVAA